MKQFDRFVDEIDELSEALHNHFNNPNELSVIDELADIIYFAPDLQNLFSERVKIINLFKNIFRGNKLDFATAKQLPVELVQKYAVLRKDLTCHLAFSSIVDLFDEYAQWKKISVTKTVHSDFWFDTSFTNEFGVINVKKLDVFNTLLVCETKHFARIGGFIFAEDRVL